MRRVLIVITPILIAAATLVAGCSGDGDRREPRFDHYVALGDSYTAGPGIRKQDASSGRCMRSDHNYPNLVNDRLGSRKFVDVSCSGATTDNVLHGNQTNTGAMTPQIDAVTADTDLITISIGANDANYALQLFMQCIYSKTPTTTCPVFIDQGLPTALATIGPKVKAAIDAVRAKAAPDVRIVLVGYLQLAPATGTCSALRIPASVARLAHSAEAQIEKLLTQVADESDVLFAPMNRLSEGHDACGDEPWTNGASSSISDGLWLHPRRAGMDAVTDEIVRLLDDPAAGSDAQD